MTAKLHDEMIDNAPVLPEAPSYTIKQLEDHHRALVAYYTEAGIDEDDMPDYADLDGLYDKQVAEIDRDGDGDEGDGDDGAVIVITLHGVRVHFLISDICQFVNNQYLTNDQLKQVAVELVANLELRDDPKDGDEISIERANFNDSFRDMEADMIGNYSVRATEMSKQARQQNEFVTAAYQWWSMHRPLTYDLQQHIENFAVNTQTKIDAKLAEQVSKWASDNPRTAAALDEAE